jgi:O-acetylserine/cysteine efflux transporter
MTASSPQHTKLELPLSHLLLAVGIAGVWGTNFVVIKAGLESFPPFLFAFLRFVLVFFPAALVLPRPKAPWSKLAAYGMLIGGGQFGLLYLAMRGHITPGLASLVLMSQVFFTIGLAVWRAGERVSAPRWFAVGLAAVGLLTIAICGGGDATPIGLCLVMLAGLSWACANMIVKGAPPANMLSYIVWASIFALPPLLLLSLVFEGPGTAIHALGSATPTAWAALLWQSFGNTLFGFAAWGWLLARYPAATVTPTALLVPIFGMSASSLLLGESLPLWKAAGAVLIIAALCINVIAARLRGFRLGSSNDRRRPQAVRDLAQLR